MMRFLGHSSVYGTEHSSMMANIPKHFAKIAEFLSLPMIQAYAYPLDFIDAITSMCTIVAQQLSEKG